MQSMAQRRARLGTLALVSAMGAAGVLTAAFALPSVGNAAAQPPPAQVVTSSPTTDAPVPTTEPVTSPPTSAPATTRPTVARTTLPRRLSTTAPSTTPPSTVPTTVAGTLPPTTAGNAPVQSTVPVVDTRPGEGKMPAWPLVLSGMGLAGTAGILGGQWFRTRTP